MRAKVALVCCEHLARGASLIVSEKAGDDVIHFFFPGVPGVFWHPGRNILEHRRRSTRLTRQTPPEVSKSSPIAGFHQSVQILDEGIFYYDITHFDSFCSGLNASRSL